LARQGYNVVPACDGLAALTELSKPHFDVVITDDRMPQLSSIEFLKQMCARFPGIPVILIMTQTQEHTFMHNDCVPFAFAPKPQDEAGLLTVVGLAARATNEDDGRVMTARQRMSHFSARPRSPRGTPRGNRPDARVGE
jgi:DNA-binding NtrC family response regulator